MATATSTKPRARSTSTKAKTANATTPASPAKTKAKGPAKPQAVANDIDLTSAVDGADLKPQPRQSKWLVLLDKLYEATIAGKVPRTESDELQFIRLGSFTNINGARTQARALERKGLDATYEFKTVTKGGDGSELWGRVIEVEA
jgi:hypothetical protein